MNPILSFPEKKWKRPADVQGAVFPAVWHKFTTRPGKDGKTYRIRIQDMTPDQSDEVWDLLMKHFHPYDRTVDFADEESISYKKLDFDYTVAQNLSVVAVLEDDYTSGELPKSNKIVGCLLLEIANKHDPPRPTVRILELPGISNAKLRDLSKFLRAGIDAFEQVGSEYLIQNSGLAVASEYRRLNIGTELFRTMERIGRTFGIPAAVVILGNVFSQGVGAKVGGFTLLREAKLVDHVDENGQQIYPEATATSPDAVQQFGYFRYF